METHLIMPFALFPSQIETRCAGNDGHERHVQTHCEDYGSHVQYLQSLSRAVCEFDKTRLRLLVSIYLDAGNKVPLEADHSS